MIETLYGLDNLASQKAFLVSLLIGLLFGIALERAGFGSSRRLAGIFYFRDMAVLKVMFTAVVVAMLGLLYLTKLGWLDAEQLYYMPTVYGAAVIGGLIFGSGMVLARGCSGRLLVLAATGNLRAVISGLVFAVVAQMSLHGWLSPLRDWLAGLWVTPNGANVQILDSLGLPSWFGALIGLGFAVYALYVAYKNRVGKRVLFMASGVGFAVALGWFLTYSLSSVSFNPVQIESATFTGPSADTLMFFLSRNAVLDFDVGLVPGVFLGAFLAAAWSHEIKLQGFEGGASMRRYLSGAAMMGFGGMLAGGCAIGAGVTGGSAFALTAWIALTFFWIGAAITDRLVDYRTAQALPV